MRFVCDSCRAQYMISDDKIGAKGVKIRCKKCGHVIVVRPAGAAAPKDEGAPAAEATAAAASNGAASSSAAGLPASLGTPPEGGLFTDVEEDEIGAVFDQVLSGAPKMAAEPAKESKSATQDAVRKLAEAEAEPDEPRAPPPNDWYVAIDEKQVGPLSVEKVKEHWDRGEVGPDSLCWRQGFGDWIPLSEATDLASVLAPRPAKPVIVAPAAVSGTMPAVSAPVESAFSAPKPTRPEIPAAPALGMEPTSGWKPSAASVLASLVKEENEALSKPPAKPVVEGKPAVPGLLDLPPPPEPVSAPALQAAPMMAAAEPMRAPQPAPMPYAPVAPAPAPAYAQPAPAYAQPAPAYAGYAQPAYPGYPPATGPGAQGGGNKTIMVAGIAAGVVVLLLVGGYFAFGRSSPPPAPPEPVKVAEATPPPAAPTPAPAPVAKTQPTPAAAANPPAPAAATPTPAPAATASAAGTTQPAAVAPAPAPTAPPTPPPAASEPMATRTSSSRERTSSSSRVNHESRSERAERSERSESVGSSAKSKPEKSDEGGDDFDDLFGPKKSEKKSTAQSGGPSTYIPPEPGSGSNVLERLGTSDIMAVVLANKSSIKRCVDEQKKRDPGISGKLVMHWVIQTSGRTTGVSVKSDEYKRTYMASCIAGLIRGWTFPRHKKQGDPIDFPFTF